MKPTCSLCTDCRISNYCLLTKLSCEDAPKSHLKKIVQEKQIFQKGNLLYKQGETQKHLLIIRSGGIKTVRSLPSGEKQITGFYLPTEVLGFDGLYKKQYVDSAIALETSFVCKIHMETLFALSLRNPYIMQQIVDILSEKLAVTSKYLVSQMGEQRVANFLIDFVNRMARTGIVGKQYKFFISRFDLGNYLGLVSETVSRILSKFQKLGYIKLGLKSITILDNLKLKQIASI